MTGRREVPQTATLLARDIVAKGLHLHAKVTGDRVFEWKIAYRRSHKCGEELYCLLAKGEPTLHIQTDD